MMNEDTKSIVASNLTVAFHLSALKTSIANAQSRSASGVSIGSGRPLRGPTPAEIVQTYRAILSELDAPEVADEEGDDAGTDAA